MSTYTLFDLQQYIRQVLALNFSEPLWISAELGQVGRSRGHAFLDLVQKGAGDDNLAQAQAVLWQRQYQLLQGQHGLLLEELLQEGRALRMQVQVDYHERFGLKLVLLDLDPAYTLGRLELQRRQTIDTLRALGFLDKNRALPLPPVLQRIAVVSSEGAAGFQDFREQLAHNTAGFAFHCRLFSAAVQGQNLETEIGAAFDLVAAQAERFDCIAVLRGGGARLDLAGFDRLELCKKAAALPLPLLTGIGHDSDESVLDLVAHTALKTPTAVAEFLIQHNRDFEARLLHLADQLYDRVGRKIQHQQLRLTQVETALGWSARARWTAARQQLDQAEAVCAALHPEAALRRGFSVTMKNGVAVRSVAEIGPGDRLETRLADGSVWSELRES